MIGLKTLSPQKPHFSFSPLPLLSASRSSLQVVGTCQKMRLDVKNKETIVSGHLGIYFTH